MSLPSTVTSSRVPTEYDVESLSFGRVRLTDDRHRRFVGLGLKRALARAEAAQDPNDPIHHDPYPAPDRTTHVVPLPQGRRARREATRQLATSLRAFTITVLAGIPSTLLAEGLHAAGATTSVPLRLHDVSEEISQRKHTIESVDAVLTRSLLDLDPADQGLVIKMLAGHHVGPIQSSEREPVRVHINDEAIGVIIIDPDELDDTLALIAEVINHPVGVHTMEGTS